MKKRFLHMLLASAIMVLMLAPILPFLVTDAAMSQSKSTLQINEAMPVDTLLGLPPGVTEGDDGFYGGPPIYVSGNVKDPATNKAVPGVPILITANYQSTLYMDDGHVTYSYRTKSSVAITRDDGNYNGTLPRATSEPVEIDLGYAVMTGHRVDEYVGGLTRKINTGFLTTASSDGSNFLVRPTNLYQNQVEFPIPTVNTILEYAYKKLNKYIHDVTSGSYSLTGNQPTITFVPDGAQGMIATYSFTLAVKYAGANIGTAYVDIKAAPALKEVDGGLALAIQWVTSNITITGLNSNLDALIKKTHITNIASIIDSKLDHTIYFSPIVFSTSLVSIPDPLNVVIWNESSLNSLTFSDGKLSVGIMTGWYAYSTPVPASTDSAKKFDSTGVSIKLATIKVQVNEGNIKELVTQIFSVGISPKIKEVILGYVSPYLFDINIKIPTPQISFAQDFSFKMDLDNFEVSGKLKGTPFDARIHDKFDIKLKGSLKLDDNNKFALSNVDGSVHNVDIWSSNVTGFIGEVLGIFLAAEKLEDFVAEVIIWWTVEPKIEAAKFSSKIFEKKIPLTSSYIKANVGQLTYAAPFITVPITFTFVFDSNNLLLAKNTSDELTQNSNFAQLPDKLMLNQNYPNPFNPSTSISFGLPKSSEVSLVVYNMMGQEVATLVNNQLNAGHHSITWNGRDNQGHAVGSGIYIYRLRAGTNVFSKKMTFVK